MYQNADVKVKSDLYCFSPPQSTQNLRFPFQRVCFVSLSFLFSGRLCGERTDGRAAQTVGLVHSRPNTADRCAEPAVHPDRPGIKR